MNIENGVPFPITNSHIGMKILYRLPNNAIAKEGIIEELSSEGEYIHVGKNWIPNDNSSILAVLSGPQKRREAIR